MTWIIDGCSACGGDLALEEDNSFTCLQCGREYERKVIDPRHPNVTMVDEVKPAREEGPQKAPELRVVWD